MTSRIKKIIEMALSCGGKRFADIGTDHAYVAISLARNGAVRVIATDVRSGPLQCARMSIEKRDLLDQIELRLGDGLDTIEIGEVDTVIIAGIGGWNMIDILAAGKDKAQRYILQPMKNQDQVREFLRENGFDIIKEEVVTEKKHSYDIFLVEVK